MRKRVGVRNYDTEKSTAVMEIGKETLYKKRTSEEFFLYGEERGFTPLEESAVIELVGDERYKELTRKKGDRWGAAKLRVPLEDVERLNSYAKNEGRSVKSLVEEWVDGLLEQEQDA